MSSKNANQKRRFRNVNIGFRVSKEESELINSLVKLSGLNKQDYIVKKLTDRQITVLPNPRVYKALKDTMQEILTKLETFTEADEINEELLQTINYMTTIMKGFKEGKHGN